jgi:very-short-patch-repair endonuclease
VSDGVVNAFIDLGWEDVKIGMEYDGSQHATDRTQFVKDIGRHELFGGKGWLMVRVVKEHSPTFILHRLYEAFARRGRPLAKSA